jgi:hypothetical protein
LDFINGDDPITFLDEYDLNHGDDIVVVALTYFGTTTLTTIGLGDFVPKSNFERIICTIMMICGVAMFS